MPQTAVKKKVSMIPAKPQYDRSIKLSEKKLRVAAYCRVSTELEEQESSYEAQVEYYTRKLKEKNVAVVFEKEGVNTLDGTGEILITILSSLAQEESRNISENTRWGVVRRFENGKMIVNHNKFMGYTKNENGDLVIVPEEAEIVRLIFRLYLEGYSAKKISQYLEENGIKTATGQDKWYDSVIFKMLRNEKYMGGCPAAEDLHGRFYDQEKGHQQGNRATVLCGR